MKLKILFAFALLSLAIAAQAKLQLTWDPSPTPGITNYAIYYALPGATNFVHMADAGVATNLVLTAAQSAFGTQFYATAGAFGLESDPSNIVMAQQPAPPSLFIGSMTVTLQVSNISLTFPVKN